MRGKSTETLKRDIQRDTIGAISNMSPVLGAAITAGIIWGMLRLILGKDSKMAKIVGTIAALLG